MPLDVYSFTVFKTKIDAFKENLASVGFSFFDIESNTALYWRARRDGICINVYKTGKVVLQGKGVRQFMSDKAIFPEILASGEAKDLIGIDESGKGDYFGPLVVAAVLVRAKLWKEIALMGVRDSKAISDVQIARLSSQIKKVCPHSLVVIGPERYNQLYKKIKNLNRLLAWGHARALENILENWDCTHALSDQFGDKSIICSALMEKGKLIQLEQTPKAEKNLAVAAASILARHEFVNRLSSLGKKYNLDFPKGAGPQVLRFGKDFLKHYGSQALTHVAKLHFKTTKDIQAHIKREFKN